MGLRRLGVLAVLCGALVACSAEPEPPADQAEARERAKQGFAGEQVKALDEAAAVQEKLDAARAATDAAVDEATDESGSGDDGR